MKNETLKSALEMVSVVMSASSANPKRSKYDYYADKLRQAASMNNLFEMYEKLCSLLEVSIDPIVRYDSKIFNAFCSAANRSDSLSVLKWLKNNAVLAIMTCLQRKIWDETLKDGKGGYIDNTDEFVGIIEQFDVPDIKSVGNVKRMKDFDINLEVTCLSPLAHGGEMKFGNATPFRRYAVMCEDGKTLLELPAFSGNAYRGIMRDILSNHFLEAIGIQPNMTISPVAKWFFHILYEGGALKGVDKENKKITEKLGKNGAIDPKGLQEFRFMIPHLSILGCAIGNRMLEGKIYTNKLRPVCKEWGFDSDVSVDSLLSWEFLIRKNDEEGYDEHTGMIANTEVLKTGTILEGGIDFNKYSSELELSCLMYGVHRLRERGYLGAQNARGIGRIELNYEIIDNDHFGLIDINVYPRYIEQNKEKILKYLTEIEALL
jgi:hypothetical protein